MDFHRFYMEIVKNMQKYYKKCMEIYGNTWKYIEIHDNPQKINENT